MSAHTKGPWIIVPPEDEWGHGRIASIEPKPESMIGENYWSVAECNTMREEHEANAKLIAAAPDLLEALKWMVEHCEPRLDHRPDCIRSAKRAIAKALAQ